MKANSNDIDQLNSDVIKAYNEGNLTSEERHRVEKLMLENELYADAVEGLEQFSDLELHLEDLDQRIDARLNRETKTMFWTTTRKLAAAITLLLISTISYQLLKVSPDTAELSEAKNAEPTDKSGFVAKDSSEDDSTLDQFMANARDTTTKEYKRMENPVSSGSELAKIDAADTEGGSEVQKAITNLDTQSIFSDQTTVAKIEDLPKIESNALGESLEAKSLKPANASLRSEQSNSAIGRVAGMQIKPSVITSISGTVFSDIDGSPLSNVIVTEKGTQNQIATTTNGKFVLPLTMSKSVLSFKSQGYEAVEIDMNDTTPLSIVLVPDFESRDSISKINAILDSNLNNDERKSLTEVKILPGPMPKDRPALPANGIKTFDRYLQESLVYPEAAKSKRVRGRVIIEFTVEEDGSTSNHKILRSLGYGCDEEAIRLIKEGPVWQPKIENGATVQTVIKKTIRFRPKK